MKLISFSDQIARAVRIFVLLALAFSSFGMLGIDTVLAAPPLNDSFANAKLITGITYIDSLNIAEATPNASSPNPGTDPDNIGPCDGSQLNAGYNTVWYKYTPTANESIAVDTIGSLQGPNDDLDTFLAIWTGTEGNLTLVACDDDNLIGQTSELSFTATAGITYFFEAGKFTCFEGDLGCDPLNTLPGGTLAFNVHISNVDVYIASTKKDSYYLYPTDTFSDSYINPTVVNGPVRVISTNGDNVVTSQRVTSGESYNELSGYPVSQFTSEYWFPYYDHGYPGVVGSNMRTWILVGNPSASQTATVNIYIGGNLMSGSPFSIPPGSRVTPRWLSVQGGPVRVVGDIPIFASERVFTSNANAFNETLGFPVNDFSTEYWFPWYDSTNMDTALLVGNTSAVQAATVEIYIGADKKGTYNVPINGTISQKYPAVVNGPVRVVSTNGVDIVTSEQAVSGVNKSFSDVIGYPFDQFESEYWFPYYDHGYPTVNGSNMRTWILVGNPSASQTATVNIYIDGVLRSGSPFSIPAGSRVTPRWIGLQGGPVRVVSNIPVFVSERVFTVPNNIFNEMMGYPLSQFATEYWYPWYDSVNMTNDILVGKP